jgi:hypothetical protein
MTDRAAYMAALDQGIAQTSANLTQMVESTRDALATGTDRALVANALAKSLREAIAEFGPQPIARVLALAIIRLAESSEAQP